MRLLMVLVGLLPLSPEVLFASQVAAALDSEKDGATYLWCRSSYGSNEQATPLREFVFDIDQDLIVQDLSDETSIVGISYDRVNYDFRISYKNKRSNEGVNNYFYLPPRSPGAWARRALLHVDLFEQEVQGIRIDHFGIYCGVTAR